MSHNRESEKETQALLEMEQQESVTEQEEQSEQEDSEQEQSEEEQEEQPVGQEDQLQDQKQSEEPSDETQQIPLKQNLQKKYTRKPGKQEAPDLKSVLAYCQSIVSLFGKDNGYQSLWK